MTDTRDKFELKISMEYEQPPCLDRDGDGYDDSYVDNAWWGWQAATEQSRKEIAGLEANNGKVILALASIRDIFEYDDEMVRSGALSYPEDVAGFVKTKVAELQAREKELVDLLGECVDTVRNEYNEMLELYSIYPHKQYDIQCQKELLNGIEQALANVRGEVK